MYRSLCDGLACHTRMAIIYARTAYLARRVFRNGVFFSREKPPINADRRSRCNYFVVVAAFCPSQSYAHARARVSSRYSWYLIRNYIDNDYYNIFIYVSPFRPEIVRSFFETLRFFAVENPLRNAAITILKKNIVIPYGNWCCGPRDTRIVDDVRAKAYESEYRQ